MENELLNESQAKTLDGTGVMKSVIFEADLRIGGLFYKSLLGVQDEPIITELGSADINRIVNNTGSFVYEAIKATKKEILSLGFKEVYDTSNREYFEINLLKTRIYLRPSLNKWYFGFVNSGEECEINDCYELEFVHEIQNLIFSLTRVSIKFN